MENTEDIEVESIIFLSLFSEALYVPGTDYKGPCHVGYSTGLVGNITLTVNKDTIVNAQALEALIAEADKSPKAFDTCLELFQRLTKVNAKIPELLSEAMIMKAKGQLIRPASRGRKTKHTQQRIIVSGINHLKKIFPDVPVYLSGYDERQSICQVIKKSLESFGIHLSYDQVIAIYKKSRQ